MAPPYNHLHLSPSLPLLLSKGHHPRRCSKAQSYFFRILNIISASPSAKDTDNKCLNHHTEICENKVDLNIRLRTPTETELPATSFGDAVGENCVFEKNDRSKSEDFVTDESELAVEEERQTEHSEISHVGVGDQSSGVDYNGVTALVINEEEKPVDEGHFGLLIEAAQMILGEDYKQDEKLSSNRTEFRWSKSDSLATQRGGAKKKQRHCWTAAAEAEWYAEFEDTSPVVKSKRGRNQVLPFKYRDSVVEPLVRWTAATTPYAAVHSKRRSK